MEAERLKKIEDLFHQAIEKSAGDERKSFLSAACEDDDRLLLEMSSLIDSFEEDPDYLTESALGIGLTLLNEESDKTLVGEMIGNYRIDERLGSGGMGAVYLAQDLLLDRQVALKFLNPALVNDTWARRQLVREARVVVKIEHRNICPIYGFQEIGEHRFIVMQYVRGEPLSNLVRSGLIGPERVMRLAIEIVEAIAAVHEHGIIHRDIKPGNIMLTPEGTVKVLDFGLAKIIQDKNPSGSQAGDYVSRANLIQGTPAYMSPEQVSGEKLDYRSDIFSIGTVLFELATGVHPFQRSNEIETAAAIIGKDPSQNKLSWSKMSPDLRPIVQKCLSRNKNDRYQSASELLLDLEDPSRRPKRDLRSRSLRLGLAAAIALILLISIFLYVRPNKVHDVAILPFANETQNQRFDYLADGIAETLSERLSAADDFKVVPYSKLVGFRNETTEPASLAKTVSADLVLTGRIFFDGDQLKVETKLIDSGGLELRRSVHPLDPEQLALAEDGILDKLFTGLELRPFTVVASARNEKGETKNNEAFRQYLIGRYYWRKRDPENLQKAVGAFKQAIDIDPTYSRAYAGLADSYVLMSLVAYGSVPPKETVSMARAAAKQAIDIDPLNAEAHTSLGVILTKHDWNWREAEREFRKAIEIDPDYAAGHYWFSGLLGITGRAAESIVEAEKAKELDPFSPLVDLNLARTYYFARQYDRSLEVLNRPSTDGPIDTKIRYLTGLVLLQKGEHANALKIFQEISEKHKMLGAAAMGYTLARAGKRRDAEKVINDLERESKTNYVPPQEIAIIYIGLNEKDKAFEYLNRAFAEKFGSFSAIKVEPIFDPIRDDVRFADLLRKMSLDVV